MGRDACRLTVCPRSHKACAQATQMTQVLTAWLSGARCRPSLTSQSATAGGSGRMAVLKVTRANAGYQEEIWHARSSCTPPLLAIAAQAGLHAYRRAWQLYENLIAMAEQ